MHPEARPEDARLVRATFTEALMGDWERVLRFSAGRGLMRQRDADLLREGLALAAAAEPRLSSEYFHYYFRALAAIRENDVALATRAVATLGNVLLGSSATHGWRGDIPVHVEESGAPVPTAVSGAFLEADRIRDGVVAPLRADDAARIVNWQDASWFRGQDPAQIPMRAQTPPVVFEVNSYRRRTSELSKAPTKLAVLDARTAGADDVFRIARAAQDLIRDVDDDLWQEVRQITEYLVLLDGNDFVGGSDIVLFGASFLRLDPRWSALCYADHIIHEGAHQLLHATQEITPLLLNRDKMGQASPIRRDPRPLYGTFHATFVFLRLSMFMHRVVTRNKSAPLHGEARMRLHRHLLGLLQGLQIIEDNAELSAAGRVAVDAWTDSARELVRVHGDPDPSLVSRLDWDYEVANTEAPRLAV